MSARRACVALAFLAVILGQAGCAIIPGQQTPIDVTVTGIVMALDTQHGIPNAVVVVEGTPLAQPTDVNGRFSFTLKSETGYTLHASAGGYVDNSAKLRVRRSVFGPATNHGLVHHGGLGFRPRIQQSLRPGHRPERPAVERRPGRSGRRRADQRRLRLEDDGHERLFLRLRDPDQGHGESRSIQGAGHRDYQGRLPRAEL